MIQLEHFQLILNLKMLNQRHKYLLPSQNMLFHVQPILQFWQKRHDCYYFNPSYDILSQIFAESYLLMNEFYCIKTTESEHPKYQYIILIISNLTRHSIFKILQASRNINENTFIFKNICKWPSNCCVISCILLFCDVSV